ncbi:aminopeptidase [Deinococcus yavapaiensis]|uniref:Aminopeptidase n=1 Tax=Deinococcus yavapaiensis KR-236 TaxID=694435 RepID=A0A318S8U8_9DEIO|nr:aminopeptidase [Deinococcus yavapaiensis]PYE52836.1 aminopeptidase [Deinococcus yavapaiensis KR-236]
MIYDPVKHAELLVDYCVYAKGGERILVAASTLALPLVAAVHDALLARGAMPIVRLEYPSQLDDFIRLAPKALLANLHPVQLAEVESLDGSIRVLTPTPPSNVAPDRSALYRRTLAPVARERAKRKWNLTLFPTAYSAQASGMTLQAYETFVANAMFLGDADPVARWGEVRAMQAQLIERLSRADEVRIEGRGTDLTLSVKGRVWANSDGKRNMPSGEVFTGPLEASANGVIRYDLATVYAGREVSGIELEFRDGTVVRARADVGDDVLQAALDTDEGARRLGELGIGTNFGIQRASKNILFDEKIGGTVHLALGNAYPETLGTNVSALHWDMICDLREGGRILLDGEVFQESGRFV